jgi:hypothetical protein
MASPEEYTGVGEPDIVPTDTDIMGRLADLGSALGDLSLHLQAMPDKYPTAADRLAAIRAAMGYVDYTLLEALGVRVALGVQADEARVAATTVYTDITQENAVRNRAKNHEVPLTTDKERISFIDGAVAVTKQGQARHRPTRPSLRD